MGGVVAGAVLVSLYALGTRLFPGHIGGTYDPVSDSRLAEPLGYPNALGLLMALAILLVLGFATHGARSRRECSRRLHSSSSCPRSTSRSAAARSWRWPEVRWCRQLSTRAAPVCSSRGSWWACRPRSACSRPRGRMRSRLPARRCRRHRPKAAHLTRSRRPCARAAAAPSSCTSSSGGCGSRSGQALSWYPLSLAAAVLVAVGALVAAGGPVTVVRRAVDSFTEPLQAGEGDLQRRLLASRVTDGATTGMSPGRWLESEPLLGTGAGRFEAHWLQERPISFYARDAHNLYLETLAELGAIGLAILLADARASARRASAGAPSPLGPAAAGAYVAFLAPRLGRLGLGGARCDAGGALLRGGAARFTRDGGAAFADGQACRRSGDRAAGPRGRPRRPRRQSGHGGGIAAIERGDPIVRSPRPSGRSTGRRGRTSPGSSSARPSCCVEDDAAARKSLKRRSSSTRRAGAPGSILRSRAAAQTGRGPHSVKRLNPLSQEADRVQTEP